MQDAKSWAKAYPSGISDLSEKQFGLAFEGKRSDPRIQLWHGEQDTFVNFKNLQFEVDQWTNVYGPDSSAPTVDEPQPGWTRRTFNDAGGTPRVQAISVAGAKHTLPANDNLMAPATIKFFGLDN